MWTAKRAVTTLLWPTFLSLLVMRLCRAVEYVAEGTCTPMQQRNILGRRKDARRFLLNRLQWHNGVVKSGLKVTCAA